MIYLLHAALALVVIGRETGTCVVGFEGGAERIIKDGAGKHGREGCRVLRLHAFGCMLGRGPLARDNVDVGDLSSDAVNDRGQLGRLGRAAEGRDGAAIQHGDARLDANIDLCA